MAKITDDEILNLIADRLEALEKAVGSEGGQELARARRMAARERRMLREETLSSENVAAGAADQLMKVHEGLAEAQSTFKALVEAANSEIIAKEKSARTSQQLLQTRQSDVEAQVANLTEQIGQLVDVAKTVGSRAEQAVAQVDTVTDRFTRLGEDSALKAELRKMASGAAEAGSSDFVRQIAMQTIRQGIESGLLAPGPKALQPKPERTEA